MYGNVCAILGGCLYGFHYVRRTSGSGAILLLVTTSSSSLHSIDAPAGGLRLELVPVPICDGGAVRAGELERADLPCDPIGWLQAKGGGTMMEMSAWRLWGQATRLEGKRRRGNQLQGRLSKHDSKRGVGYWKIVDWNEDATGPRRPVRSSVPGREDAM